MRKQLMLYLWLNSVCSPCPPWLCGNASWLSRRRDDDVVDQPRVADSRRDGEQRRAGDGFYGAQGLRVDGGDVIDRHRDPAEVALLQDHVLHRRDQAVGL